MCDSRLQSQSHIQALQFQLQLALQEQQGLARRKQILPPAAAADASTNAGGGDNVFVAGPVGSTDSSASVGSSCPRLHTQLHTLPPPPPPSLSSFAHTRSSSTRSMPPSLPRHPSSRQWKMESRCGSLTPKSADHGPRATRRQRCQSFGGSQPSYFPLSLARSSSPLCISLQFSLLMLIDSRSYDTNHSF